MRLLTRLIPAALIAAGSAAADTYNGYEMPPFQIERRLGDVEIRSYAPMILAEVTVDGPRRSALTTGFRILAGYIFGANAAGAEVAMTVPVGQSAQIDMTVPVGQTGSGDGPWTISFMMPARWTLETLPRPQNDAIGLRRTGPMREAVAGFSGMATETRLAEVEAELRAALAAAGLTPSGPVRHYYYDDPFTLPWARRNEVALPL